MHIKLGFVHPPDATIPANFKETYNTLVKRSRPSLVSGPPVCTLILQPSCNLPYVS